MRSLIRFILRYHATFLFIIIETICISIIVSNNYYQRTVFNNLSEIAVGKVLKQWSIFTSYFHLKEENMILLQENLKLKNELQQRSAYSRNFVIDSIKPNYYYHVANIISNSINKQKNYIGIDIGLKQGIAKEMGVIGTDGIVGIVYNCSENYASVIPIINTNLQLSVKLKKNNFIGSLSWSGSDYRFAQMSEIPVHIKINIGDTIVTSGYSSIFPPDLLVGTIEKFTNTTSIGFYDIKVKLFTNFAELREVYVIDNKNKNEIKALEQLND